MSIDIEYYRKIQNMNGCSTVNESKLYEIQSRINSDFDKSLDCYSVVINDNDEPQYITIVNTDKCDEKKITSRANETFFVGDIIFWKCSYWLVYDVDTNNEIYTSGKMKECNYLLKWQNSIGEVFESWVITELSGGSGISENKNIITGSGNITVKIPFNSACGSLAITDKRLMINSDMFSPVVYKITVPDTTTFVKNGHGYILLTAIVDYYDAEKDNKTLKLCDYITGLDVRPTETETYLDVYCASTTIRPTGRKTTITAQLKDIDGNVISMGETYSWNIVSNIQEYLSSVITDNILKLSVATNCDNYGEVISITAIASTGQEKEITLTVKEVF